MCEAGDGSEEGEKFAVELGNAVDVQFRLFVSKHLEQLLEAESLLLEALGLGAHHKSALCFDSSPDDEPGNTGNYRTLHWHWICNC